MAQVSTSDFRKGAKVIVDGDPYDMIECNFVKPGKGQALYKTRLRNLLKGSLLDRTYKSGDSLEGADIRYGKGQYLYRDGTSYVFMENETFEQFSLAAEVCEGKTDFLQENAPVEMLFWNEQLIEMTPPTYVTMQVTYTEPATRGNTSTNVTKSATVESGAEIQVPAFINEGDRVKIDTTTGKYVERVKD